jgi:SRSO17 transposase
VLSRLPGNAPAWLDRLSRWLEPFEVCFPHVAQRGAFRRYLLGLLSDSRRKSMSAMWERVHDPGTYQAFQHFISHAPWDHARIWRQLRATIPDREGVLILDATSFPKQGTQSVGVARQYCGTLGKVANCQVAVTAALWTGVRAWFLGARLYLPEEWLTREQRTAARIPMTVGFESKWRQALRLVRQLRAAGFAFTAVLADAEFGDVTTFRAALHRLRLPYALGISSHLTVFTTRPRVRRPPANRRGRPRTRLRMLTALQPIAVRQLVAALPPTAWRRVTWRNGRQPRRTARFTAMRVTPAHEWRQARVAPEVWLLCEEERDAKTRLKYYFVALPETASLRALVHLAHQRWAIEQQYQELKGELGLDHFEGRSYPGWHHHVVLTAVAHAYIQRERMRRGAAGLTFPAVRAIVQEIFTALLFAAKPRYMHWMEQAKRELQLRI